MKKILLLCTVLIFTAHSCYGQVGINTDTPDPTSVLDVNGNLVQRGHISVNGGPGVTGQLLVSDGTNNPPVWGPQLKTPLTGIGVKVTNFVTLAPGKTKITVTDPDIVGFSATSYMWNTLVVTIGTSSGDVQLDFAEVNTVPIFSSATGQWIFIVNNPTALTFNGRLVLGALY